jgi:hypothetical protein
MSDDGRLKQLLPQNLVRDIDWQRIESSLTGGGIPDLNAKPRAAPEFWVEAKQTKEWAVTLRPDQVGWALRRIRHGGRVFIAVRRHCEAGKVRPAADELWLIRGSFAKEAKRGGLRALPPAALAGRWPGGPTSWNWAEVRSLLLTSPT